MSRLLEAIDAEIRGANHRRSITYLPYPHHTTVVELTLNKNYSTTTKKEFIERYLDIVAPSSVEYYYSE